MTDLLDDALWIAWGWHVRAPALVVLQVCLAAMHVRGMLKSNATAGRHEAAG